MRVPGFTAEGSLAVGRQHPAASPPTGLAGAVLPQEVHRYPPIVLEQQHPDPPHHCSGAFDCVALVAGGGCPGGPSSALCSASECWC